MTHATDRQLQDATEAARQLVDDNMRQVEQVLVDALQPIGLRPVIGRPPMLLVADLPAPGTLEHGLVNRTTCDHGAPLDGTPRPCCVPCTCPPDIDPSTYVIGCPRHESERAARELAMLPQCAACGVTGQPMQPNGTCADDAACCSRIVERASEGVHTS